MQYVLLDTSVASLSLKGTVPASLGTRLASSAPAMSFVTVGELTQWAELQGWTSRRRGALDRLIARCVVIPCDEHTARIWGRLSAAAYRRGRPRPQNDMWIAACGLAEGMPIATLNAKDFSDFAEHHGLDLILN